MLYIDWAHKKELIALKDNEEVITSLSLKDLKDIKNDIIYIETGCPSRYIIELLKNNNQINLIEGFAVKTLRADGFKSDEEDVRILRSGILSKTLSCRNITQECYKMILYDPIQKIYELYSETKKQTMQIVDAFRKEYPEELIKDSLKVLEKQIKILDKTKDAIKDLLVKDFKHCVKELDIKGVGEVLLARILILANPIFFPSRSKYLRYCGYSASCKTKYNRLVKSLYWFCADEVIRHKSELRKIYDKIKEDRLNSEEFKIRYESMKEEKEKKYKKSFITLKSYAHKVAKNRLATFICKAIYDKFNKRSFDTTKVHQLNKFFDKEKETLFASENLNGQLELELKS